ncbi:MAG: DUF1838 family protein [Pseudomonadota bacterium]
MSIATMKRRTLLQSGAGLGLAMTVGIDSAANAQGLKSLDLATPGGILNNYIKLLGSLRESNVYVAFSGTLWGMAPDRVPEALCGFGGLARHQWNPKGQSYRRKSFDVGYFSDLESGEPIDTMVNPFTGETVEPFHYKYGGGEQLFTEAGLSAISGEGDTQEAKPYDLDWQSLGNQIWLTEGGGGEFPSPLPRETWPRESSGDAFRFASETTYSSTVDQLANPELTQADYTLFWSSVLSWEPWLLMDGKPGFVMWRGVGAKLRSYQDAPRPLLSYIEKEQSNYFDKADPWEGVVRNFDRFKAMRKPAS